MTRSPSLLALGLLLTACGETPQPARPDYPAADSAGARLLTSRCMTCHVAPLPSVHTAAEWAHVVERMQMRMRSKGYPPLSEQESATLVDYLQAHAAAERP